MSRKSFCLLMAACWTLAWPAARAATLIVDGNPHPVPGAQFDSIQAALAAAAPGDEIVVQPGTYFESIDFAGKNVRVHSVSPQDPKTVAATVIDAQFFRPVVRFSGTETSSCTLEGFTLTRGLGDIGGGISVTGSFLSTRATIRHNIIANCHARFWGGGIYACSGLIEGNTIQNCSASLGGGLYGCSGRIVGNVIAGNLADEGGGRYHFTVRDEDIPRLTLQEARSAGSQSVIRGAFRPPSVTGCSSGRRIPSRWTTRSCANATPSRRGGNSWPPPATCTPTI